MAKNWTLAEATHEIFKGDNKETIIDIGRRFPMLLTLVKGSLEGNKEDFVNLIDAIPEYITANKVNTRLKADAKENESDESDESENVEEKVEEKVEKKGKKAAKKVEEKVEDESETEANEYEGKSAQELFKLCKKRGLDVLAKKNAKYYVEKLVADDSSVDDVDDEDDWGEEEVAKIEKKVKKPAKKDEKKAKKPEPESESDDDDDDEDWDI